jgi:hypothetical protein
MEDDIVLKIQEKFKVSERVSDQLRHVVEHIENAYILYSLRPVWNNAAQPWTKSEVFKLVFMPRLKIWKLYWMRASGRWNLYGEYKSLNKALEEIDKDKYGCFWG